MHSPNLTLDLRVVVWDYTASEWLLAEATPGRGHRWSARRILTPARPAISRTRQQVQIDRVERVQCRISQRTFVTFPWHRRKRCSALATWSRAAPVLCSRDLPQLRKLCDQLRNRISGLLPVALSKGLSPSSRYCPNERLRSSASYLCLPQATESIREHLLIHMLALLEHVNIIANPQDPLREKWNGM